MHIQYGKNKGFTLEYVKIKWGNRSYRESDASCSGMSNLAAFLTLDVGDFKGYFSFKDWICDSQTESTSGNFSFLKKEGDNILVGCQFDSDPYRACIRMPQKELIFVLDRWDELVDCWKAQEIIITRNGDTFTVEGHGFREQKD